MILIIPLGGTGERFKKQGYSYPKALVPVDGKPILYWLLDNLISKHLVEYIYIPYNKEYESFDFENKLKKDYPGTKFKFLCLKENTRGAAETLYI